MDQSRPKWLRSTKGAPFTGIGSLEADILSVVWEKDRTTVRAVYETLRERRQIAYTTVMTVMNNLVKKHLLAQDKSNIAYVYTPAIPGREVAQDGARQRRPQAHRRPAGSRGLHAARAGRGSDPPSNSRNSATGHAASTAADGRRAGPASAAEGPAPA